MTRRDTGLLAVLSSGQRHPQPRQIDRTARTASAWSTAAINIYATETERGFRWLVIDRLR
jgi:hypothetical protein